MTSNFTTEAAKATNMPIPKESFLTLRSSNLNPHKWKMSFIKVRVRSLTERRAKYFSRQQSHTSSIQVHSRLKVQYAFEWSIETEVFACNFFPFCVDYSVFRKPLRQALGFSIEHRMFPHRRQLYGDNTRYLSGSNRNSRAQT